jgi:AcrR family transcriptional regulator
MARKSNNTDRKLIEVGKEVLINQGANAISMRKIAAEANVNLGMFSYHFRDKDDFVKTILDEIYAGLIDEMEEASKEPDDLKRLEKLLLTSSRFSRDNQRIIVSIFLDAMMGHQVVIEFIKKNFGHHIHLMTEAAKACQQKGLIKTGPTHLLVTQIVGNVCLSNLIFEMVRRMSLKKPFGMTPSQLAKSIDEDFLQARIQLFLSGLQVAN